MADKQKLTKAGYKKLQDELKYLVDEAREEVKRQLAEARAQGDLSENADYDAARGKQAEVEPCWTNFSVLVSILEVASSRIITGASATAQRAILINCLWPCDRLEPLPLKTVLNPSGKRVMKSYALAILAASYTSSSVACKLPYLMFSITVPVKRLVSCKTIPKERRKSAFLILLMLIPSYLIFPSAMS